MVDSPRLPAAQSPDQRVVLVVDDELIVLKIARIALEGLGFFVLEASDGPAALELSREFPGIIHLLVSDITMPKMDGARLAGHLLEERPGIKVLLMSGHSNTITDHAFLSKPFLINDLKRRAQDLLAKARAAG